MLFEQYYAAGLGKFRISVTTDTRPPVADLPPDVEGALTIADTERTPEQKARLMQHFLSVAPELTAERAEIEKLRSQIPAFPTTLVMQERPAHYTRPTFVHNRGEFLQPKERVTPGCTEHSASAAEGREARPPHLRALAGRPSQSARGARHYEPAVGSLLRHGNSADDGRFRLPG
jgi:hypothetical protein